MMRTSYLVVLLISLIGLAFISVFLFIDVKNEITTIGVEIEVHSGQVAFQPNNGEAKKAVQAGQTFRAADGQAAQLLATPTAIQEATEIQSDEEILSQTNALVALSVIDTASQPIEYATGTVMIQDASWPFQLNDQGQTVISNLPTGETTIQVFHPSIFDEAQYSGQLHSGTNSIQIAAARKAKLLGYVNNAFDNPISGASIWLESVQDDLPNVPQLASFIQQTTDDGRFVFDPLIAGDYIVHVSADSYLPLQTNVRTNAELAPIILTLRKKSLVRVAVQDQDSNPIFHARVTLQAAEGSGFVMHQETSESTGQTTFENISPGRYEISAEHIWFTNNGEGKKAIEIEYSEEATTLTLTKREYSISGKVFNKKTGEPISNAEVVAFLEESVNQDSISNQIYDPWDERYTVEPNAKMVSGDDGRYQFNHLQGGTYMIGVSPRKDFVFQPFTFQHGFENVNPKVVLQQELNVEGIDIGLLPSWSISGKVLLQDGSPLAGAEIKVKAEYGGIEHHAFVTQVGFRPNRSTAVTTSNEDGTYRFEGNAYVFTDDFKLFVNAFHNKFRSAVKDMGLLIKPKPGEKLTNVDLVYESKAIVRGRVTDEQEQGLDDVQVNIGNQNISWNNFYTDASGYYEAQLEPGEYPHMWVNKKGYHTEEYNYLLTLKAGYEINEINFQLEKGEEWFAGQVLNEKGEPVSGLDVSLSSSQAPIGERGYTNSEGRFQIEPWRPIPENVTEFIISVPATETYEEASMTIYERWAKDIELVVKEYDGGYGSIAGIVMNQQRERIQEFEVKLVPTNVRSWSNRESYGYEWRKVSHPDGAFLLQNVPVVDGPFTVMARSQNYAPAFSQTIHLQKDEAINNMSIVLQESTFSVFGQVVDQENQPLPGARIIFQPKLENHLQSTWGESWNLNRSYPSPFTDETGRFRLEGLPASGGEISINRYYPGQQQADLMVVPLQSAQPGEERDLGLIQFRVNQ